MTVPIGLTDEMLGEAVRIFQMYPQVVEVKLYGSRALGTFRPGSDVDFALFGEGVDSALLAKIAMDFDDSSIPVEVDLHTYAAIQNDALIAHIDRVGISVYQR